MEKGGGGKGGGQEVTLKGHGIAHLSVACTHHDTGVLGATHDGGEHGTGCIITCKPSLAHTTTIVYN